MQESFYFWSLIRPDSLPTDRAALRWTQP